MDLYKAIGELRARKEQLERIIAQLEELQGTTGPVPTPSKRRGRKSMGAKERAEVSKRMKNYWASRAKRPKDRTNS
ncbi:MAG: 2-hydroxyacyl-CoA dehydratase family protein [Acidobacteriia bacterium]|nr:2-hydroxyacyl-CoA dehydratase family protein [Terriglobia bacterium]